MRSSVVSSGCATAWVLTAMLGGCNRWPVLCQTVKVLLLAVLRLNVEFVDQQAQLHDGPPLRILC